MRLQIATWVGQYGVLDSTPVVALYDKVTEVSHDWPSSSILQRNTKKQYKD
jgi:hypothetical protein